jgi:hypothetical protein
VAQEKQNMESDVSAKVQADWSTELFSYYKEIYADIIEEGQKIEADSITAHKALETIPTLTLNLTDRLNDIIQIRSEAGGMEALSPDLNKKIVEINDELLEKRRIYSGHHPKENINEAYITVIKEGIKTKKDELQHKMQALNLAETALAKRKLFGKAQLERKKDNAQSVVDNLKKDIQQLEELRTLIEERDNCATKQQTLKNALNPLVNAFTIEATIKADMYDVPITIKAFLDRSRQQLETIQGAELPLEKQEIYSAYKQLEEEAKARQAKQEKDTASKRRN